MKLSRVPKHIGIIPDGNRRWALEQGLEKKEGYSYGVHCGEALFLECNRLGIEEITFYGFTIDNTKRPTEQKIAFQQACVQAVMQLTKYDVTLYVIGNTKSPAFPKELLEFANRPISFGTGGMRVNFLVNYGWNWDLNCFWQQRAAGDIKSENLIRHVASKEISRIDLIIRWGGRRRLSGFLPLQSIYADFYVIEDHWPDYQHTHLYQALEWYQIQDVTLGG